MIQSDRRVPLLVSLHDRGLSARKTSSSELVQGNSVKTRRVEWVDKSDVKWDVKCDVKWDVEWDVK